MVPMRYIGGDVVIHWFLYAVHWWRCGGTLVDMRLFIGDNVVAH